MHRLFIAGLGNRQYLFGLEIHPACAWWLGERAVGAHVATQGGERDEHLAAVGDDPAAPLVTEPLRLLEQRRRIDSPSR